MHITAHPSILYFGTPVALLSTLNQDGSANLAPMSSVFWLGWRCFLGLQGSSKTTEICTAPVEWWSTCPPPPRSARSTGWPAPRGRIRCRRTSSTADIAM